MVWFFSKDDTPKPEKPSVKKQDGTNEHSPVILTLTRAMEARIARDGARPVLLAELGKPRVETGGFYPLRTLDSFEVEAIKTLFFVFFGGLP